MKSGKRNIKKTIKKRIDLKMNSNLVHVKLKSDMSNNSVKNRRAALRNSGISPPTPQPILYDEIPFKKGEIPKRIFFFWGNEKMSWMRYMTLFSFRKLNPDWEIKLYITSTNVMNKTWNNNNVQDFHTYNGINYFEKIKELNIEIVDWKLNENKIMPVNLEAGPSHLSNFFKWSKLYEDGGIYADLDILWFKPIDSFYDKLVADEIDVGLTQTSQISIGLLASSQGAKFYRDILVNGVSKFNADFYQTAGVMNVYSLYRGTSISNVLNVAIKRYPELKFYNIPMDLVYYYDSDSITYAMESSLKINDFSSNSIGYHWYAGHPISQKYNQLLTEDNYTDHNVTFSNISKEIMAL
jgi:mannosyltransferase OCH1-like enzyme